MNPSWGQGHGQSCPCPSCSTVVAPPLLPNPLDSLRGLDLAELAVLRVQAMPKLVAAVVASEIVDAELQVAVLELIFHVL